MVVFLFGIVNSLLFAIASTLLFFIINSLLSLLASGFSFALFPSDITGNPLFSMTCGFLSMVFPSIITNSLLSLIANSFLFARFLLYITDNFLFVLSLLVGTNSFLFSIIDNTSPSIGLSLLSLLTVLLVIKKKLFNWAFIRTKLFALI